MPVMSRAPRSKVREDKSHCVATISRLRRLIKVRDNKDVDRWKVFEMDRALGTRNNGTFLEGIAEDGIHEAGGAFQFHQDRGMSEEGNFHSNHPPLQALAIRSCNNNAVIDLDVFEIIALPHWANPQP